MLIKDFVFFKYILFIHVFIFKLIFVNSILFAKQEKNEIILNPITVIGTKTKNKTNDILLPIIFIGNDTIKLEQPESLDDVLQGYPSLEISGGPRSTSEKPVIRGMSGRRVLIIIDGVKQNFNSGHKGRLFLDIDEIKKIEIIRGPSSALYGSDAIGGVISLNSKDGIDYLREQQNHGFLTKLGFHSINNNKLINSMIYGLLSDNIDYLISLSKSKSDDIKLGNGNILKNSSSETLSNMFKLVWYPNINNKISYKNSNFNKYEQTPLNSDMDDVSNLSLVDKNIIKNTHVINYNYSDDFTKNNYIIDFNIYESKTEINEFRRIDQRIDNIKLKTHGLEFIFSDRFNFINTKQKITYGLEDNYDIYNSTRNGGILSLFPKAKTQNSAIFLQNEISIYKFNIIPGIRYDRFFTKSEHSNKENTSTNISKKLHFESKIFDNDNIFISYSEGFRTPSIQELFISGLHYSGSPQGVFVPNPYLSPEESKNYEFGIKLINDEKINIKNLNINYYQNYLYNFIDSDVYKINYLENESDVICNNPGSCLYYKSINIKNGIIEGTEIQYRQIYRQYVLDLNYSKIIGINFNNNDYLSNIPADKVSSNIKYDYKNFLVGIKSIYAFKQDKIPKTSSRNVTDEYLVHNIYSKIKPTYFKDKIELYLSVNNLSNLSYRKHLSSIDEAGRNFKIQLQYVF